MLDGCRRIELEPGDIGLALEEMKRAGGSSKKQRIVAAADDRGHNSVQAIEVNRFQLTRGRCGSDLRQTFRCSRPCRCESDQAFRKSGPGLLRCQISHATVPAIYRCCSRDCGTI